MLLSNSPYRFEYRRLKSMLGTKLSPEELLHLHTGFLSKVYRVMILFFLQAIGLSLRDLLAHVDEEIQRLDPSSHKEVSLH